MGNVASNTVEGGYKGGGHHKKHPQDFEKGPDALNSTPYSKYQDGIQKRNHQTMTKSKAKLKQD